MSSGSRNRVLEVPGVLSLQQQHTGTSRATCSPPLLSCARDLPGPGRGFLEQWFREQLPVRAQLPLKKEQQQHQRSEKVRRKFPWMRIQETN
mmetsp:Transcript_33989/g.80981  ORF Transcript_33989/g.80981 Transcript_33989/m.80981 type:complete len:92 (-) Transcript_33989:2124-2399(-)